MTIYQAYTSVFELPTRPFSVYILLCVYSLL